MNIEGLPIEEVFKEVRKDLGKKTGGQQVPWELSSLEGQFYFSPGKLVKSDTAAKDELDDENRKLEAEQSRLETEKAAFAKQKALDEKRQQIAEEKERLAAEKEEARQQAKKTTTIAMGKRPSIQIANEIKRDGRFIAYSNRTVLDTKTNLMWAAKDNGNYINWGAAKTYCENYSGGGYTDWRMPTQAELAGLYDKTIIGKNGYKLTSLIELTSCCLWGSDTSGSDVTFAFDTGGQFGAPRSIKGIFDSGYTGLALPVRSIK